MKVMKRIVYALLLTIALIAPAVALPSSANAASDYDDLLQLTPELYVYTDGAAKSEPLDISTTWLNDLEQTYAKRVAQNIGFPSNFITVLDDIIENGGSWGVIQQETEYGTQVSIIGTTDPSAECSFSGPASTGSFGCVYASGYDYVSAGYFTHNSYGNNGCWGSGADRCSDNGMNIYGTPYVITNGSGGPFWGIWNEDLVNTRFFVMNMDIEYPLGYEGVEIPQVFDPLEYVALGDSFSSGEGVEPFLSGTDEDEPNENRCHRSESAYPELLGDDPTLGLELTAFVACSGATTDTLVNGGTGTGSWGEGSQIDGLNESTDIVTITIGGNDVGFKAFATECYSPLTGECDEFTPIYDSTMEAIDNLEEGLTEALEAVLDSAENAQVYVVGYPHQAPFHEFIESEDPDCTAFFQPFLNPWGNGRAARNVVNALDDVISDTVTAINGQWGPDRLIFVDTRVGEFEGHDACAGEDETYFNYLHLILNQEYTAHPNTKGQVALKNYLSDAID